MAGRFSVEAVFKAIDRVTAPVSRMQNRVGKFTRSMGRGLHRLDKATGRIVTGLKRVGVAAAASMAIVGTAFAGVVGTGADFEQTVVNAAAKFPGEIRKGTEAFAQLEKAARRTGSTTEFTASQSAEALNFLAMAGFNAEASVAALPGVVDLATAAQVDLATATDVASDSLGAFGLMTNDSAKLGRNLARVNDVIAKTTTSANTTVESLFETIKDGAPVATSAGASLETFAALAGEMANAGIKGSRAGTTLKNVFLSLSAPSSKASKILGRLGIATKDSEGNMRDVIDILGDLNKATADLGTADRSGVLEGIFGKIPIAGVNVLLDSGADRLRAYRRELEGASGAASTMAGVMRDTVRGRLNSLNSAIEGVSISIFSMTQGPLAEAIDKTTEWVRSNEDLIATNVGGFLADVIDNFESIVTWTKRIAVGLGVFFLFIGVLKTFILVMTAVNLVMAMNPIGLIVLAIGALIAVLAAAIIWWDEIKAAILSAWDAFTELGPVKAVIGFVTEAAGLIMSGWSGVGEFFAGLFKGLVTLVTQYNPFSLLLNGAFDLFERLTGIDLASVLAEKLQGLVTLVTQYNPFSLLLNGANSVVKAITGIDLGAMLAEKVKGLTDYLPDWIKEKIGIEDAPATAGGESPQVVSPQERTARSIDEQRTTSTAEVTIRDETGRADMKQDGDAPGVALKLQPSGVF